MSIIPTTSKRLRVPYTVVGGQKTQRMQKYPSSISLLLLNRGGRPYRSDNLIEFRKAGFDEILSIEGPSASYDVEALSRRFPFVRFLLLQKEISTGEQVNIGIEESKSRSVFVTWNDMKIPPSSISVQVISAVKKQNVLCTAPVLQNSRSVTIPSVQCPAFNKIHLKVIPLQPSTDGLDTLFPYDFCGVYNKEKFLQLGGFDHSLGNAYWQKMDFGFRSHMWGERIICNTALKMRYLIDVHPEDTTRDESYKRFFLKNLSIRFTNDYGTIPVSRFLRFYFRSGTGFFAAVKEFRKVREWVSINKYRFKRDARSITELWEVPD